jgi:hypothetical protein
MAIRIHQLPKAESLKDNDLFITVKDGITSHIKFVDLVNAIPTASIFPYSGSVQITGHVSITGSYEQGNNTSALDLYSHAEGEKTKATGAASHAEGYKTLAQGDHSHAEGKETQTFDNYAHAEGGFTVAAGPYSHAEGQNTKAVRPASHAEGQNTEANGYASHTEGFYTIAQGDYQHVQGQWNQPSIIQSAFIVGNGTDEANRSNLILAAGNQVQIKGTLEVSQVISLESLDPLPTTGIKLGSFANSGSGEDIKPYFWNGVTWTPLF